MDCQRAVFCKITDCRHGSYAWNTYLDLRQVKPRQSIYKININTTITAAAAAYNNNNNNNNIVTTTSVINEHNDHDEEDGFIIIVLSLTGAL